MGYGAGYGLSAGSSLAFADPDVRSGAVAPLPGRLFYFESDHLTHAMLNNGVLFINSVTGTAANTPQAASEAGHQGIVQPSTGTDTNGRACVTTDGINGAAKSFITSATHNLRYSCMFRITDLSTAVEEYDMWHGFSDRASGMLPSAHGAGISYDRNASLNWSAHSDDGGANRVTDTGVVVAEDVWIRLRVEIIGTTEVRMFINNVLVATHAGLTAGRLLGAMSGMLKGGGTTARTMDVDYVEVSIWDAS